MSVAELVTRPTGWRLTAVTIGLPAYTYTDQTWIPCVMSCTKRRRGYLTVMYVLALGITRNDVFECPKCGATVTRRDLDP